MKELYKVFSQGVRVEKRPSDDFLYETNTRVHRVKKRDIHGHERGDKGKDRHRLRGGS